MQGKSVGTKSYFYKACCSKVDRLFPRRQSPGHATVGLLQNDTTQSPSGTIIP